MGQRIVSLANQGSLPLDFQVPVAKPGDVGFSQRTSLKILVMEMSEKLITGLLLTLPVIEVTI